MKKVMVMVLVLFIMTASDSIAGMPYTFSPGTAIKSSEVNADLQYVNYGNIVVKANGVEIGTPVPVLIWNSQMTILNSKGFLIRLDPASATVSNEPEHYHTTTDCTGTPYVRSNYIPGTVLTISSGEIFYIDKAATATAKTTIYTDGMVNSSPVCNQGTSTSSFYPLTPNDPSVTGVSSATFGTPITIERR